MGIDKLSRVANNAAEDVAEPSAAAASAADGGAPEDSSGLPGSSGAGTGTPTYIPRRLQQQEAATQIRLAVQRAEAETIHRPIQGTGAAQGVRCCCAGCAAVPAVLAVLLLCWLRCCAGCAADMLAALLLRSAGAQCALDCHSL